MDDSLPPPDAPQRSLWMRFLLMLVMALAFYLCGMLLLFLAILQLAFAAFAGGPEARVRAFGASLGRYFGQLVRFVTFESEAAPFPFDDWPQDPATAAPTAGS